MVLEESVGDCREVDNRELEAGVRVNNDIAESQLGNLQYKLNRRNGKFSRERRQGIIEPEIPGPRQDIPQEETYNWYGNSS